MFNKQVNAHIYHTNLQKWINKKGPKLKIVVNIQVSYDS